MCTPMLRKLAGGLCLLVISTVASGSAPRDVAEVLKEAATEVSYLGFDKAYPLYAEAQQLAQEGSEQWQAAVFGQALCLQQIAPVTADRLQAASSLYTSLIERYPDSKYTPQAMMAMGRMAELVDYLGDQPDREAARQWYAKAREKAGEGSDLSHEATLRIAATYVQSYEPDQCRHALEMLEQWLAKYPNNPLASAMWQYSGDTWFFPLKDEKKAVACYLKADELGLLEQGREGPIYWKIANLAQRNGMRDIAIQYFTKVIVKTPTSGKAYESQLALQRLGAPVPRIEPFERRSRSEATRPTASDDVNAAERP